MDGNCFVYLSTPSDLAGSCKLYEQPCIGHTQNVLFYTGLAFFAVGIAGHLAFFTHILKEKEDESYEREGSCSSCKVLGCLFVLLVLVVVAIALPYINKWSIRFGIPAICTVVATLWFFTGLCEDFQAEPWGSPLTNVCRVFVASACKICQPFPFDAEELYGRELQGFSRSRLLRFLEKAAIIIPGTSKEEQKKNRWRLCSVSEVEEAKIMVRMLPMWLTFIIFGAVYSCGSTFFLEQAKNMNHKIGKWTIPLQILLIQVYCTRRVIFCCFNNMAVRFFPGSKKHASLIGIAMVMIFSVLCCITSARIEIRRLDVIRRHNLLDKPDENIPMSVCWLLFQYFLLTCLTWFFGKSVSKFFKHQAPKSMRTCLTIFSLGACGLGFVFNVLLMRAILIQQGLVEALKKKEEMSDDIKSKDELLDKAHNAIILYLGDRPL
ncbi:protein NRT1/ PTR FAMILY 5.5-like [Henckelia pumila]|uniref:protein NRT1/ PTR FAMILY 5.5-like n=1 Tax=Henckelia pumila TaxID=405737 RepID=UPI003C6E23DF